MTVKAAQCIPFTASSKCLLHVDCAAMIECSDCGEWLHTHCVSLSPAALKTQINLGTVQTAINLETSLLSLYCCNFP